MIAFYSAEPDFFDDEEQAVLGELAADIGFSLEVHRREAERATAEASLHESEARFRQVADNIQEVFWMTDVTDGRALYVSPAYERIWGRSPESLYRSSTSWVDTIHLEDRARVAEAAATQQALGTYDEVYRIVRPDGRIRWIHDRALPIRDPAGGAVVRVVGTAEDITTRRELEEQLRQAQKMEAIGQLAGGVAHDFNNILMAMMGEAEMAGSNPEAAPELKAHAAAITALAERAAALTRQLLLFSRRQVMRQHDLDLNDVVANLSKMLQRIIGEDVILDLALHPAPLVVHADAGMLDQVLMNLAVNARDAMPGGGRLRIETGLTQVDGEEARRHPDVRPGPHVRLRVRDTGTGIPANALPRIFEPFFTTKDVDKGTGLGLATVFGIVRQHAGWIGVESELGQGTVFEIFLPARDELTGTLAAEPVAAGDRLGGSESVLLVEDDPSVRAVTRAILERAGYQVLATATGSEAIEVSDRGDPIDLLLTDMVLPGGISGSELARRLRRQRPVLRVLVFSGYSAEIAGRDLGLESGSHFLQKPCTAVELLTKVRACLDE